MKAFGKAALFPCNIWTLNYIFESCCSRRWEMRKLWFEQVQAGRVRSESFIICKIDVIAAYRSQSFNNLCRSWHSWHTVFLNSDHIQPLKYVSLPKLRNTFYHLQYKWQDNFVVVFLLISYSMLSYWICGWSFNVLRVLKILEIFFSVKKWLSLIHFGGISP